MNVLTVKIEVMIDKRDVVEDGGDMENMRFNDD